jgi:hypothetical protein
MAKKLATKQELRPAVLVKNIRPDIMQVQGVC